MVGDSLLPSILVCLWDPTWLVVDPTRHFKLVLNAASLQVTSESREKTAMSNSQLNYKRTEEHKRATQWEMGEKNNNLNCSYIYFFLFLFLFCRLLHQNNKFCTRAKKLSYKFATVTNRKMNDNEWTMDLQWYCSFRTYYSIYAFAFYENCICSIISQEWLA